MTEAPMSIHRGEVDTVLNRRYVCLGPKTNITGL